MANLGEMDVMIQRAHEEVLEADSGPYAFGPSRTDQVVCALSSLDEAQLRKKIDGGACSVTRDATIYEGALVDQPPPLPPVPKPHPLGLRDGLWAKRGV